MTTSLYLEVHQSLADHPKTKKAIRLLGISKPQFIGHMVCLWWWCQKYAKDGDLSGYDNADIAEAAGWEGDPDKFITALLGCGSKENPGFLIQDGPEFFVNDWHEYGGKLFTERERAAKKQRDYRERQRQGKMQDTLPLHDGNVTVTSQDVTPLEYSRVDRDQTETETLKESESSVNGSGGGNGHATVDPSLFLTVIGFKDPEPFLKTVDTTCLAMWAYHYATLTEPERKSVKSWPALINSKVRAGEQPRWKNGELKTAFYRAWTQ